MVRPKLSALVVAIGVITAQQAPAQVALFDAPGLLFECTRGNCENAIVVAVQQIRQRRLSEDEFNSQLGVLAAVLLQAARAADVAAARQISLAIEILAGFSTDQAQGAGFLRVAGAIVSGDAGVFGL
ncbi:MAG: hypothetical protein ACC619_10670, partial [Paracoccaceae bacterium]